MNVFQYKCRWRKWFSDQGYDIFDVYHKFDEVTCYLTDTYNEALCEVLAQTKIPNHSTALDRVVITSSAGVMARMIFDYRFSNVKKIENLRLYPVEDITFSSHHQLYLFKQHFGIGEVDDSYSMLYIDLKMPHHNKNWVFLGTEQSLGKSEFAELFNWIDTINDYEMYMHQDRIRIYFRDEEDLMIAKLKFGNRT